jgi:hypothetical protein
MLTETQLSQVGNFDTGTIAGLRPALGGGIDAVSAAGALSLTAYVTELTVSGTKAYTLAAPTVAGQRKRITCVSAASTPLGTVTVSSPDDTAGFVCASAFTFDAVGQSIELIATSALKWRATRIQRSGKRAVVVGTTVLTGLNLSQIYSLAVTGTVVSDSTKGLPNGSAVGERCNLVCDTAALSPVGSINGTYKNMLGTAATDIQAIGVVASASVVGDMVTLEWDGAAWQAIFIAGVTFA